MHLHSHDAAAVWCPWRFRCLIYMYGLWTMTPSNVFRQVYDMSYYVVRSWQYYTCSRVIDSLPSAWCTCQNRYLPKLIECNFFFTIYYTYYGVHGRMVLNRIGLHEYFDERTKLRRFLFAWILYNTENVYCI